MPSHTAAYVYADQLISRGHGLPLWQPEPTSFGEILVGDVGFVEDGCFYRLFNILRHEDDPANARGVPEGFVALQVNEEDIVHTNHEFLPPGPVFSSQSVQCKVQAGLSSHNVGAAYTFNCNGSQGAMAVLGDFGSQSKAVNNWAFRRYMREHHASWQAFAFQRGFALRSGDVVLVFGWLKTSEWAIAAVQNQGRSQDISFNADFGAFAVARFGASFSEETQVSVEQRCGPPRRAMLPGTAHTQPSMPRDQCLFLRYYKLKSRLFLRTKIVVEIEARDVRGSQDEYAFPPQNIARISGHEGRQLSLSQRTTSGGGNSRANGSGISSYPEDSFSDIEEVPETEAPPDPLDHLADYILQHSDAEVAIVSHDELYEIFQPDSWPEDINVALELEVRAPSAIVVDGIGTLSAPTGCAKCVALKVRCELVEGERGVCCRRCQRANVAVVQPLPTPGRIPQRTSLRDRMSEQEKLIKTLRAQIEDSQRKEGHQMQEPFKLAQRVAAAFEARLDAKPTMSETPFSSEAPPILRKKVVSLAEAGKLLRIFWDRMNLFTNLLDPEDYPLSYLVNHSSPFLFTVICAVASRHYTDKPTLYRNVMKCALLEAGHALIEGSKTIDHVYAYLLLALYPTPSWRWEHDRSWIYLGVATQMAMDLGLDKPSQAEPTTKLQRRAARNGIRAWLFCFNLDRLMGPLYGTTSTIKNSDYVANHADDWWYRQEPLCQEFDIHLVGMTEASVILERYRQLIHSHSEVATQKMDTNMLASDISEKLTQAWNKWSKQIRMSPKANKEVGNMRTGILKLVYSYARMTVLCNALCTQSWTPEVGWMDTCYRAAMDVLNVVLEDLGVCEETIFAATTAHSSATLLRYAPDVFVTLTTFACTFLLQLLQPRFVHHLRDGQHAMIIEKVQRVIDMFRSSQTVMDEHHNMRHYAHFLTILLSQQGTLLESLSKSHLQATPSKEGTVDIADIPGASPIDDEQSISSVPNSFFAPPLPFEDFLGSMEHMSKMGVFGFAWMKAMHLPSASTSS